MDGLGLNLNLDDPDTQRALIGRPAPQQPVTLRGLSIPASAPSSTPASTATTPTAASSEPTAATPTQQTPAKDAIAEKSAAIPPTISPLAKQTEKDRATQAQLGKGSGIAQIGNPWARAALRGLNIAGEIGGAVVPEINTALRAIPGTEEHHQALVGQNQAAITANQAQAEKEAQTAQQKAATSEVPSAIAKNQADAAKAQAEAEALKNAKAGLTPEETTLHDLMTGNNGQPRLNPQTQKPFTYLEAYAATKQAAENTKAAKTSTPEQQFIDEYQKTHKGATVEQAVRAYAQATKIETPQANQNRADKSYALISGRVDKLRAPIDQLEQRMGRLNDSLAQGTPQADATIAPELLSVMAGGAGSGLRMNESEIARIVGGRSKWQSLEAAVNQWHADPTKANSITPEQRKEIHALVDTVNRKLLAKQQILEETDEGIINSDDPKVHRQIYADAQKKLNAIDAGASGGAESGTATGPKGEKIVVKDGKWVDAKTGKAVQ